MSFIGEAALSASIELLLKKLASMSMELMSRKYHDKKQVHSEIKKLEKMLTRIWAVLDDAEEKQISDRVVKIWLSDLQDLAYDVEDILDEFDMESLQHKLKGEPHASPSKARKFIPTCCTSFSPRTAMFNSELMSKIKEITTRLEDITSRKNDLELRENFVGVSSKVWQRPPSTCLQQEPQAYGRDEDKRKILELLLRYEMSNTNVGVVPIFGMGGVGKTTLARLVYNDEEVQHFHPKAWVSVSDAFDILRITKSILESITLKPCDLKELNQVQLALHKELVGKKFLIVLDDVWNENYEDWNALRAPFMDGAPGSRILVTTRSSTVAQKMGTVEGHILQSISDDDCWSLFAKHAFENRTVNAHPNLKIIREKVTTKCAGLPLAAITLGGLLRAKHEDEWEDILNSNIWSLQDDQSGILPVLRLSYHHLPSNLKRCFAYCAIFPKDYEFDKNELIFLWMAEGLIQPLDSTEKQMEDVGSEYFQELLSRSFFQASIDGDECFFVMHDLVNDLAQWVVGETCLNLDDKPTVSEEFIKERARHFSCIPSELDGIKRFEHLIKLKFLRTFLPLSLWHSTNYLSNKVPFDLIPKLKCLRVLSFSYYNITELPDSIGDLKHLRYLNLSYTKIRSVPESVTSLYNLQTLLLEGCRHLKRLPSIIGNLINLRHLDIINVKLADGMPMGIKELKNLRTLSYFPVSKDGGDNISALLSLKFLRGRIHVSGLENVIDPLHARKANLIDKKDLDTLLLEWKYDAKRNERLDRDVLDELQPHTKLKALSIKGYSSIELSSWVGDPSFYNLMSLRLENCKKCMSLPQLGLLPSLKELIVKGMSSVRQVGQEFHGQSNLNRFPTLERLHFINMKELEEWNPCEVEFPCLCELMIKDCPKLLGKFPKHLSSLKKLVIRECYELAVQLPKLPMLSELEVRNCKELDFSCMSEFYSLTSVVLHGTLVAEEFIQELEKAKTLSIRGCCPCPRQLPSQTSSQLEIMKLGCESLLPWSLNLMSLRLLTIDFCPFLVSFPEGGFLPMLRAIRILSCRALTSLPNVVYNSAKLEDIEIHGCDSLKSFGRGQLPPNLKRLKIRFCKNLQILLDEEEGSSSFSSCNTYNLEHLLIFGCASLTSLSAASKALVRLKDLKISSCSGLESIAESFSNNTSLERIKIQSCSNLKSLPEDFHKLINLRKISIVECPSLVSFPSGGLPTTHLKQLQVQCCEKLEALPDNINNLKCLRTLVVYRCPSIVSFPEEGFPIGLTVLDVSSINISKPLFEWGLHRFASLKKLCVQGGCADMISFPEEERGMMLPTSLTHLSIIDFPNLEYLSTKGLESLASLELLLVQTCPKLASLPKSLPPSLLELYINNCPLLKRSYQKSRRQERSKIDYIPCVKIDMRSAFRPENDPEEEEIYSDEDEMYDGSSEEEMNTDFEEEETDSRSEEDDEEN